MAKKYECKECKTKFTAEEQPGFRLYGKVYCGMECVMGNVKTGDESKEIILEFYEDGRGTLWSLDE